MTLLTYKTKDRDKGITRITYNNIGLVDSILFDNGAKVLYTYGVNGEKLRVRHYAASSNVISHVSAIRPGTNTIRYSEEEYIGGELVKSGSVSGTSSTPPTYKCYFGDGYISFNSFDLSFNSDIVPEYYYYSKDHLGNVRSVVTKKESTNAVTEVQKTHYYPFGGIIADLSTGRSVQNRLYNGKEFDNMHGLNTYDYGARQYNPVTARWDRMDRYSEKYYSVGPCVYCANNPVNSIDENGDSIAVVLNTSGAYGFGHMGILVQKDKDSWVYYSKNGHSEKNNDGSKKSDYYTSVNNFMKNNKNYNVCFVIHDGKSNEKEAIKEANEDINTEYSTLFNNCAQFVQNVLKSANLKEGKPGVVSFFEGTPLEESCVPNLIFKNIVNQNKSNNNRLFNQKKK